MKPKGKVKTQTWLRDCFFQTRAPKNLVDQGPSSNSTKTPPNLCIIAKHHHNAEVCVQIGKGSPLTVKLSEYYNQDIAMHTRENSIITATGIEVTDRSDIEVHNDFSSSTSSANASRHLRLSSLEGLGRGLRAYPP
jgi:hypothetical protein